jgi:hypothetical protein
MIWIIIQNFGNRHVFTNMYLLLLLTVSEKHVIMSVGISFKYKCNKLSLHVKKN